MRGVFRVPRPKIARYYTDVQGPAHVAIAEDSSKFDRVLAMKLVAKKRVLRSWAAASRISQCVLCAFTPLLLFGLRTIAMSVVVSADQNDVKNAVAVVGEASWYDT